MQVLYEDDLVCLLKMNSGYGYIAAIENKTNKILFLSTKDNANIKIEPNDFVGVKQQDVVNKVRNGNFAINFEEEI